MSERLNGFCSIKVKDKTPLSSMFFRCYSLRDICAKFRLHKALPFMPLPPMSHMKPSSRACLKNAFCQMCVTICGRFVPNEGLAKQDAQQPPISFPYFLHIHFFHQRRPVRRYFDDLAFPQGEELISHINILRRILLSSPRGNPTASSLSWIISAFQNAGYILALLNQFCSAVKNILICIIRHFQRYLVFPFICSIAILYKYPFQLIYTYLLCRQSRIHI